MKLELSGNEIAQPIDETLISNLLNGLSGDDSDSFLILSRDEMSYIQTYKTGNGYFVMEYQEKTADEHYECTDAVLNTQKVLMAFSSYLRGTNKWKTSLTWKLQDSSDGATGTKPVKFLVMVGLVLLFAFTLVMISN